MDKDLQQLWDDFLQEWPLERLRRMTLPEYTAAGQSHTFTSWIERRLDRLGSIWGGSSFKFGIFSRKDRSEKPWTTSDAYTQDYAWYRKYGSTSEEAFARVKSLVVQVAEAAARGDYAAIDEVDLGDAYKWKIAFHYQDRENPGIIAVFKPKRLQAWLRRRVGAIPQRASDLHRLILSLRGDRDLIDLSKEVWGEIDPDPVIDPDPIIDQDPQEVAALNLILYGPPGTGKTYETASLAVRICDGSQPGNRKDLMARYRELRNLHRIRFVTFHPSFSYEEFVEGIRPVADDGQVHYEIRAGIFKQVASHARELFEKGEAFATPPNCVLIIDEINRANLAKTFGELITLLEPSKRLGQADEQEAELPYSGDRLGVPPNLYVIGTMNTADRSIALMDTALRRRFAFREMPPRPDRLASDLEGINLQALLAAMNERIEKLFDRDHVLGHTYLMGVASFEELVQRFQGQIIPLLQEYFFEDWGRIQKVFNDQEQPYELQIVQEVDAAGGMSTGERRRQFRVNSAITPAAIQKIYS